MVAGHSLWNRPGRSLAPRDEAAAGQIRGPRMIRADSFRHGRKSAFERQKQLDKLTIRLLRSSSQAVPATAAKHAAGLAARNAKLAPSGRRRAGRGSAAQSGMSQNEMKPLSQNIPGIERQARGNRQ